MWPSRTGTEPVSPTPAGGLFTTEPSQKPRSHSYQGQQSLYLEVLWAPRVSRVSLFFINAHSALTGDLFRDSLHSFSVLFSFQTSLPEDGIYPSGFYGDKRSWLTGEYLLCSNILGLSTRKNSKGTRVWVEGSEQMDWVKVPGEAQATNLRLPGSQEQGASAEGRKMLPNPITAPSSSYEYQVLKTEHSSDF